MVYHPCVYGMVGWQISFVVVFELSIEGSHLTGELPYSVFDNTVGLVVFYWTLFTLYLNVVITNEAFYELVFESHDCRLVV